MKLFLVLAVVLIGVWIWRSGRQADVARHKRPPAPQPPQDMVSCALCAVHVPQADAIVGHKGVYCSVEHRQRAES